MCKVAVLAIVSNNYTPVLVTTSVYSIEEVVLRISGVVITVLNNTSNIKMIS